MLNLMQEISPILSAAKVNWYEVSYRLEQPHGVPLARISVEQIRGHQTSHARPHNGNADALFGLGGRYHFEYIMRIIQEVLNMGTEGMLWAEREASDIR